MYGLQTQNERTLIYTLIFHSYTSQFRTFHVNEAIIEALNGAQSKSHIELGTVIV